ncbi:MAG: tyrosine-type recombinase/integrase [Tepidisphaeraceae bacterium]
MTKRFAFTRARLEQLAFVADPKHPKRDRLYFWDARQPSLALAVTSGGAKVFYVVRKVHRRVERIKLARFPDIGVEDARTLAQETIGKIAGGQNPAEQRRVARGEQTLGDVFTRFIDEWGKIRKRTWQDDQQQFDRHCGRLKGRRLSTIRLRDVQSLHSDIGKDAPYSANRLLALLSSVFGFARTIGYEGVNPCKGVRRFKEQSRRRFLRADEMPKFLAALEKHPDEFMADFFRLLLFTGARRSNVQAGTWSNINFARKVWTIPAAESKSGQPINVHLTDAAMEVLRRRWAQRVEGSLYVFPSYGRRGHITEPKAAWKQILERAGISDLRIHDLRRTYGSWLTAGGAPAAIVAEALGQTTTHVTHVYSRVDLATVAGAVDLATGAMLATKQKQRKRKMA